MKKIISRVGIGVAAIGVVSAVVLGITLNQPAARPKVPDAKATSETKETKDKKDDKDIEGATVTASSNNEAPVAPGAFKAQSTPSAKAEARSASTTSATPTVSANENTQNDDNTVVEDNTDSSTNDDDEALAAVKAQEEREKAASWVPPNNTTTNGGRMTDAVNTYPYKDNCPLDNAKYYAYGGSVCQTTSYVSWKAYEKWEITNTWGGSSYNYVNASGYYVPKNGTYTYVNTTPAPYTIAVQTGGSYGHVMWVESVNENGSINVTEYNVSWPAIGCYAGDFCSRRGVGTTGTYFIHFE